MKIAVVDDSAEDRNLLTSYLRHSARELNCEIEVFAHSLGENFLEDADFSLLDVVFLDIFMGATSGMEVAKALRAEGYLGSIIFCTTTADFALEGYDVKAAGYLVKPFTYEKIARQLRDLLAARGFAARAIRVKDGRQWHKINLSDILYAEKQGNYVCLHTLRATYSTRMSLGQIQEQLLQYRCFVKCDRGIVVNLENVQELEETTIRLRGNGLIPVSRSNRAMVNDRYFDFIFEKME